MGRGLQHARLGPTSSARGDKNRSTLQVDKWLQALATRQKSAQRSTDEAESQDFIALQLEEASSWKSDWIPHFDNVTGVLSAHFVTPALCWPGTSAKNPQPLRNSPRILLQCCAIDCCFFIYKEKILRLWVSITRSISALIFLWKKSNKSFGNLDNETQDCSLLVSLPRTEFISLPALACYLASSASWPRQ